jgi:hypothetical protein
MANFSLAKKWISNRQAFGANADAVISLCALIG